MLLAYTALQETEMRCKRILAPKFKTKIGAFCCPAWSLKVEGCLGLEVGAWSFRTQSRNAVSGLVALAVSCGAASPDSRAARPASTASLNATAIRFGSF